MLSGFGCVTSSVRKLLSVLAAGIGDAMATGKCEGEDLAAEH